MTDTNLPGGHVLLVCNKSCRRNDYRNCMWCDGGLTACTLCYAFEGAWPDECPGVPMAHDQSKAVHAGELNYRDGQWREGEICQVMRPTYDYENWKREVVDGAA
jgi:hypothetical protein